MLAAVCSPHSGTHNKTVNTLSLVHCLTSLWYAHDKTVNTLSLADCPTSHWYTQQDKTVNIQQDKTVSTQQDKTVNTQQDKTVNIQPDKTVNIKQDKTVNTVSGIPHSGTHKTNLSTHCLRYTALPHSFTYNKTVNTLSMVSCLTTLWYIQFDKTINAPSLVYLTLVHPRQNSQHTVSGIFLIYDYILLINDI